jgi:hypothetical protein
MTGKRCCSRVNAGAAERIFPGNRNRGWIAAKGAEAPNCGTGFPSLAPALKKCDRGKKVPRISRVFWPTALNCLTRSYSFGPK